MLIIQNKNNANYINAEELTLSAELSLVPRSTVTSGVDARAPVEAGRCTPSSVGYGSSVSSGSSMSSGSSPGVRAVVVSHVTTDGLITRPSANCAHLSKDGINNVILL